MSEATDIIPPSVLEVVRMRQQLAKKLDGKDISEMEIEVERDAAENDYNMAMNPYLGTNYQYAKMYYWHLCTTKRN